MAGAIRTDKVKEGESQRFEVSIDSSYTKRERLAIGQEVIDFIVDRTSRSQDVQGGRFKKYSPEYVDSKAFKIAGKREGKVNLTLTGDMLTDIKVLSQKKGEIVVGYSKKTKFSHDKAEGNNKDREFLGIMYKDLNNKILNKFPIKDKQPRKEEVELSELSKDVGDRFKSSKVFTSSEFKKSVDGSIKKIISGFLGNSSAFATSKILSAKELFSINRIAALVKKIERD
jgi:hypothetical protein